GEVGDVIEPALLHLERGGRAAAGGGQRCGAGEVPSHGADRGDVVGQAQLGQGPARFDRAKHQVGGREAQVGGDLAHGRVADDHVEAAVQVRVPVRLVAGVDDGAGAGGGGGDRLPHVVAASGEDELRARPLARFAGDGGGDAA